MTMLSVFQSEDIGNQRNLNQSLVIQLNIIGSMQPVQSSVLLRHYSQIQKETTNSENAWTLDVKKHRSDHFHCIALTTLNNLLTQQLVIYLPAHSIRRKKANGLSFTVQPEDNFVVLFEKLMQRPFLTPTVLLTYLFFRCGNCPRSTR